MVNITMVGFFKTYILVLLVLITSLTTVTAHRHKHNHHKSPSSYNDYNYDSDEDSENNNQENHSKHHLKSNRGQRGRGILANLFSTPFNIAKNLLNLDPVGAFQTAVEGYGSAAKEAWAKVGEFSGALQEHLGNLAQDEWNDLFNATDRPINYLLYTQRNKKVPTLMTKDGSVDGTFWNIEGKTKVIIYSLSPDPLLSINHTQNLFGQLSIKNSYLNTRSMDNVIVADWTALTRTLHYLSIPAATRVAGADIARFLYKMLQTGTIRTLQDVHLIGFSLGAHVAGIAGNIIQTLSDGDKIGRITGLDPAGPFYELISDKVKLDDKTFLDKKDARFVDIIHCNIGVKGFMVPTKLGMKTVTGSADFFPNGAKEQKNCGQQMNPDVVDPYGYAEYISCCHSQCWMYFAESVGSKKYPACKCGSWDDFIAGKCTSACEQEEVIYMGDLCSTGARGTYYLHAELAKPHNETFMQ